MIRIILICALFISEISFAQIINEEQIPSTTFLRKNVSIIPLNDSAFFLTGNAAYENHLFEDIYTYTLPYFALQTSSKTFTDYFLPDTFFSISKPLYFMREIQSVSSLNYNSAITHVVWSKIRLHGDDVAPFRYLDDTSYISLAKFHDNGFDKYFSIADGLNPSIAVKEDNSGVRMVCEKISVLDTFYLHSFRTYSSSIHVYYPDLPGIPEEHSVIIGKGFNPIIKKGFDDKLHVLWFEADSNTAEIFHLKHSEEISPVKFDSAVTLYNFPGTIPFNNLIPQLPENFQWNVDSSGTVHIVWSYQSTLFSLHYSKGNVVIDSTQAVWIESAKAFFYPNDVHLFWRTDFGSQHATELHFSSLVNGRFFSNTKTRGIGAFGDYAIIQDTSKNYHVLDFTNIPGLMQSFVKNAFTEKETTILISGAYSYFPSAWIDKKNRVWVTAKKDSSIYLLNFMLGDLGKKDVIFPLHIGDEWQYIVNHGPGDPTGYLMIIKAEKEITRSNGKTYTVLSSGKEFRKDGLKIYSFNPDDSTEYLQYDFSRQPGDTLDVIVNYNTQYKRPIVFVNSYRSRFGTTYRFEGTAHPQSLDFWSTEVTDSIGITGMECGICEQFVEFQGAIIDGKKIGIVVNVDEQNNVFPDKFMLFQNYPNPFNPTTKITYQLPITANVRLKVFDVLGREMEMLVNDMQTPGIYSVQFDASRLSSGVYFYRLEAGNYVQTKKMLMLK